MNNAFKYKKIFKEKKKLQLISAITLMLSIPFCFKFGVDTHTTAAEYILGELKRSIADAVYHIGTIIQML